MLISPEESTELSVQLYAKYAAIIQKKTEQKKRLRGASSDQIMDSIIDMAKRQREEVDELMRNYTPTNVRPHLRKCFKALNKRDGACVATGDSEDLCITFVIPPKEHQVLDNETIYSPKNSFYLSRHLKEGYERCNWIFDADGKVSILDWRWIYRRDIINAKMPISGPGENQLSADFINIHNNLAMKVANNSCPYCWELVGHENIGFHRTWECLAFGNDDSESESDSSNDEFIARSHVLHEDICSDCKKIVGRTNMDLHRDGHCIFY